MRRRCMKHLPGLKNTGCKFIFLPYTWQDHFFNRRNGVDLSKSRFEEHFKLLLSKCKEEDTSGPKRCTITKNCSRGEKTNIFFQQVHCSRVAWASPTHGIQVAFKWCPTWWLLAKCTLNKNCATRTRFIILAGAWLAVGISFYGVHFTAG